MRPAPRRRRAHWPEILETVDAKVGQELQRIGPFDREVCHVVRLVEKYAGVLPPLLLVTPIRVFRGNARVNIRSGLGITQHIDRVSCSIYRILKVFYRHDSKALLIQADSCSESILQRF
jgi:hypothetical protein